MCGRYAMSIDAGDINKALARNNLNVKDVLDADRQNPTYNVGPTKFAPTYRKTKDGDSIVQYMSWGLIPFWTKKKEDANQYKTFNARKESVIDGQKLWKPVRKHSRCVVPIEGYYEWLHKQVGQSKKVDKIPYYLRRKDKNLIFLAGLFDFVDFKDTGDKFGTFTIITGPAPKQTKWLHERMPIVLTPGTKEWDDWLDNDKEWDDKMGDSLKKYAKEDLEWYEVSKDVGKVSNDGEYLVKPLKKGSIGDFFSKNKKPVEKEEESVDINKEEATEVKKEEEKVKEEHEPIGGTDDIKDLSKPAFTVEDFKKQAGISDKELEKSKEEEVDEEHSDSGEIAQLQLGTYEGDVGIDDGNGKILDVGSNQEAGEDDEESGAKRSAEDEDAVSSVLRHDEKRPKVA